ncbi:MAG: thioesterase family protein [Acidimicrobiia bacterium]
MPLVPGLAAKAELTVAEVDTALAIGSGDVPVLATPRLVSLFEEAALHCVEGYVPAGSTTVGIRVQIDHLHPTSVGSTVIAEATLDKVEGRRLTFTVSANDRCGLIAAGKVTRVIVDTERFMEKAR